MTGSFKITLDGLPGSNSRELCQWFLHVFHLCESWILKKKMYLAVMARKLSNFFRVVVHEIRMVST